MLGMTIGVLGQYLLGGYLSQPSPVLECPRAMPVTQVPCPDDKDVEPTPSAPPKPVQVWERVAMSPELVGEWQDADYRPLPLVTFREKAKASKTPFNLVFRDRSELVSGGCGFYESGDAYCKIFDADNRKVARSRKSKILLERKGDVLRVTIEGVASYFLRKVPVPLAFHGNPGFHG
jgi:hypothetical protein